MELRMEAGEAELLERILSNYLGDLRMEVAQTDSPQWRKSLKDEEETIKSLLARLRVPVS